MAQDSLRLGIVIRRGWPKERLESLTSFAAAAAPKSLHRSRSLPSRRAQKRHRRQSNDHLGLTWRSRAFGFTPTPGVGIGREKLLYWFGLAS